MLAEATLNIRHGRCGLAAAQTAPMARRLNQTAIIAAPETYQRDATRDPPLRRARRTASSSTNRQQPTQAINTAAVKVLTAEKRGGSRNATATTINWMAASRANRTKPRRGRPV